MRSKRGTPLCSLRQMTLGTWSRGQLAPLSQAGRRVGRRHYSIDADDIRQRGLIDARPVRHGVDIRTGDVADHRLLVQARREGRVDLPAVEWQRRRMRLAVGFLPFLIVGALAPQPLTSTQLAADYVPPPGDSAWARRDPVAAGFDPVKARGGGRVRAHARDPTPTRLLGPAAHLRQAARTTPRQPRRHQRPHPPRRCHRRRVRRYLRC